MESALGAPVGRARCDETRTRLEHGALHLVRGAMPKAALCRRDPHSATRCARLALGAWQMPHSVLEPALSARGLGTNRPTGSLPQHIGCSKPFRPDGQVHGALQLVRGAMPRAALYTTSPALGSKVR